MYRNWSKKTGKRYILGFIGLFLFGIALFSIILLVLKHRGADISGGEMLVLTFLLSLIPAGSFSGFVVLFNRVNALSKKQQALLVVFCIPITIFAIPFGIIMLVPSIIATIRAKNA